MSQRSPEFHSARDPAAVVLHEVKLSLPQLKSGKGYSMVSKTAVMVIINVSDVDWNGNGVA
jgi:hypothetical protein